MDKLDFNIVTEHGDEEKLYVKTEHGFIPYSFKYKNLPDAIDAEFDY